VAEALIGHTGFVGGNLAAQHAFTHRYHSRDIDEIADRSFDLIVCAGMPAEKWRANQEPQADRASLTRLVNALARTEANRFVLVSTVDVYPTPRGVDEESPIDETALEPYGLHRLFLERFVRYRYRASMIVRLPGLFGSGLKKNVIFDLLNGNQVDRIHADSKFQFYSLDTLWRDLQLGEDNALRVVNFATAPVSVSEIAAYAFGFRFDNRPTTSVAHYDVRSRHAPAFGGSDKYLQSKATVLERLRQFVTGYRSSLSPEPPL
jgi:nucleoside-diphosphate-sugar epimerase